MCGGTEHNAMLQCLTIEGQQTQPVIRKRGREVRQWRSVDVSKAGIGQGYKGVPDEIRATLLDYVLNHGFTTVGVSQRVQPNVGTASVSSVIHQTGM